MAESLNVYDFDKTVYAGDSSLDFWKFCLRQSPKIVVYLPKTLWTFLLYLFGLRSKTQFKESFFRFLFGIPDSEEMVLRFWTVSESKLMPWFLSEIDSPTLIISASPEFLLRPVAKKLGVLLIASNVDPKTGRFLSKNCYGEEKLLRFSAEFPDVVIGRFYSDSRSDAPLAACAQQAFMVFGEEKISWEAYRPSGFAKMKETFFSKDFLLFLFCGGMGTLTNFVCSLAISTQINPTLAYVFGYGLSLFVAYSLNARLIFHAPLEATSFGKFVVSYIPNFLILFTFVSIFLNIFLWNEIIVYALAAVFGLPVTFVLVKIFAFRTSSQRGG